MNTPTPNLLSLSPLNLGQLESPSSSNGAESTSSSYDRLISSISASAQALISTLTESPNSGPNDKYWKKGRTYNKSMPSPTLTYSATDLPGIGPLEGNRKWHCRISDHSGAVYEHWRAGLFLNHSRNEAEYIETCVTAEQLHTIKPGETEVWRTAYNLAFPASNRDFTFVILTLEDPESSQTIGSRSFTVVSIPFESPTKQGYLRSRYVSVEHVKEIDGGLRWIMATASVAGGMVPQFIGEMALPSKICEDVPSFVEWLKKK